MFKNDIQKAYFQLHTAVFIFGFTAILGKVIECDQFSLVFHRMWLAAFGFLILPNFFSLLKSISIKQILQLLSIGVLVALHWLTFYGSIKIGKSASLTLGCFGLTSFFTSLIEPIIFRKKLKWFELQLGLLALVGIYIIAYYSPDLDKIGGNKNLAIIIGVISSFLASLFSTINSGFASKINTRIMTFYELIGGFIFLVLILSIYKLFNFSFLNLVDYNFQLLPISKSTDFLGQYNDIFYLILLAFVCTNLAFVINLNAMKKISAFTANLAINLEPVYGIILAAFLLKEYQYLNIQFYLGAAIILLSVLIHSLRKNK